MPRCYRLIFLALLAIPAAARAQEPTAEDIERAHELAEAMRDSTAGAPQTASETLSGSIPPPDALYTRILEGAKGDSTALGEGLITYQGLRLVFYPQAEVIVLEGQAEADQAGTVLKADRILYRSREGIVEAFGNASVSRGPSQLGADSLFYDRETGVVATFGVSILREGESQTEGVDLRYDMERRSGTLGGGVTTYAPWVLEGQEMSKIGEQTFVVADGHFTTCELDDPHYRFVSDAIKLRKEDVIVAAPVVLYFSDVPVFYLPWYVEPVTRGRHTGFLRPQIGINTLLFGSGRERSVQDIGFYYVFNDYADATLAADWYTESRFIMRLNARYNLRYAFQGSTRIEQVWNRIDHSSSRLVQFRHDHTLGPSSRATVDVNWSNSRSFLRRNSFDPEEILQRSFRSAASYTTRFDWGSLVAGSDADFRLDVNRTDFRLADIRLSINQRPLWGRRTPGGGGALEDRPWWQALQYSANAQSVARLSRAQVDSLGNPLSQIPVDSLGRPIEGDTETVINEQESRFTFTLNGPLNLFGLFQTTPSLSYNANVENDQLAEGEKVGGRGQLSSGVSVSSRFFRIFRRPIGPILAMRHTVAPSLSVNYAPAPNFWGSANEGTVGQLKGTFFANLSLTQDFDVKLPIESPGDPVAPDSAAGEEQATGEIPTRTVNLLNISNALGFDVTRHREPGTIGFRDLSTRISSGLGETFNISTSLGHELVEIDDNGDEKFSPFLSRLTTDFSIRRGGGVSTRRRQQQDVLAGRGAEEDLEEAREGLEAGPPEEHSGFGPWSLSLTHSWTRDREGVSNRQSVGVGAQLLPSAAWSLNYQTNYDITDTRFQGQTLSLVRQLHDWTASLNVSFFPSEPQDRILVTFSVFLTDAPDLEVPYRIRRE